jgi:hypothetical protein
MNIISRSCENKSLSELIDDDVFEPYKPQKQKDCNESSDKEYRIPEHQRFYKWGEAMQTRLIESVMCNLPLDALMFSKHKDGQQDYFMIQNGQQRMTTLHNFKYNKCHPSVKYDKKGYDDFDAKEKQRFDTYQVPCQFISKKSARVSDEAYNVTLTCIFERLNSGKPLTDNEKYHARRNASVVDFATKELIEDPELSAGFATFVSFGLLGIVYLPVGVSSAVGTISSVTGGIVSGSNAAALIYSVSGAIGSGIATIQNGGECTVVGGTPSSTVTGVINTYGAVFDPKDRLFNYFPHQRNINFNDPFDYINSNLC